MDTQTDTFLQLNSTDISRSWMYCKSFIIEKGISKGHILHNSTYMTLWKRQNGGAREKLRG